jgi:protein-S-isoprenylcysteine O-methyltransferase Ste14
MKATHFEYRYRFWIQALIYVLGFAAPWTYLAFWNSGSLGAQALNEPAWLEISTLLYRQGWLTYNAAVVALLIAALVFTGLGAWLRLWGAAYTDADIVQSDAMQAAGGGLLADGPYRRTRNPLYLGTLLHTIGISVLMPPSGAIFAIVLLWLFQVRLALAEESLLMARCGQPYLDYKNAVPRFLPAPTPQVASAGRAPVWGQALLREIYFVGALLTLAIFGWSFDRTALRQGILISLGVALIARAFVPRMQTVPIKAT